MARFSNPSGSRFQVWNLSTDPYEHIDLQANWDAVDAIIGVPNDLSAWPPSTGVGGGLWSIIQNLKVDRPKIGDIVWWYRPSATIPIPTGRALCDGSTISAADHDFDTAYGWSSPVTLPNLLNRMPLGADPNVAAGTAATASTAPGEGATGGSHTAVVTITQPDHAHTGPSHAHSVPDHTHPHYHKHRIGGNPSTRNGSPVGTPVTGQTDTGSPYTVATYYLKTDAIDTTNTSGHPVPHVSHVHGIGDGVYAFDSSDPREWFSDTGKASTDGSGVLTTSSAGSGSTSANGGFTATQTITTTPPYVGLLPLMVVKYTA